MKAKAIAIGFLTILILTISQGIAITAAHLLSFLGLPGMEALVAAIVYPVCTFFGIRILLEKRCDVSLNDLRIKKFHLTWYWVLAAIALPVFVVFVYILFVDGIWVMHRMSLFQQVNTIIYGVLYYSLAAGLVEELVFRGVWMGLLEKAFGCKFAIVFPSLLFGIVHVIGNTLDFISTVQLLIAGTLVGILFSLIAYQSDNIWNNALVHACWNASTVGWIHIGMKVDPFSVYTYVLHTKSFLISGGDFGIESSVIAMTGYIGVSAMALLLLKCSHKEVARRS